MKKFEHLERELATVYAYAYHANMTKTTNLSVNTNTAKYEAKMAMEHFYKSLNEINNELTNNDT